MHRVPQAHLETVCATCSTSVTSSPRPRDRAETGIQKRGGHATPRINSVTNQQPRGTYSSFAGCGKPLQHCGPASLSPYCWVQHFQLCPCQLKFFGRQRSRHPHMTDSWATRHVKTPSPKSASARQLQRPKRRQMSGVIHVGNPYSDGHWTLHPDVRNLADTSSVEIAERQHCAVHANFHFPNLIARVFASNLHI